MKKLDYVNMCLIRIVLIFILDSQKYLVKKTWYKIAFGFIKQVFIRL